MIRLIRENSFLKCFLSFSTFAVAIGSAMFFLSLWSIFCFLVGIPANMATQMIAIGTGMVVGAILYVSGKM